MDIDLNRALLWIVLLPLAGAIVNGVVGRYASRQTVHTIAVGSVALAFALGVAAFCKLLLLRAAGHEDARLLYTVYEWFSITVNGAEVPIYVRFLMDPLGGVMTLVVTGVGLLIHVYACGYMAEDPSYARFFCYMNLFMAAMLILVLGSSLPVMFVGWEGVGLCSYLLIGFWFENRDYASAGRKAFVTNRIGDFGALIGMFLLVQAVGSFEFLAVNQKAAALADMPAFGAPGLGLSVATAAALFLFLGCTGKSAQIPLFVWLPDAMAGPTPVSALIHAATMVTSGVYLICRLSPVFAAAPAAMAVVAVIGALTAFLAATIALVQVNMKRVLAYSTVSQLGFMFAAVGCGAFGAGIFHVYTHAFFKACLFLGAGSVMHAVGAHGDADIRTLGGLHKYQPRTHWTFLVSCAAIAGVPLFSGFFSKDEILVGALSVGDYFWFAPWLGQAVFALLVVAATMTAFYMFRLHFVTFYNGEYRGGPSHGDGHGNGHHSENDAHGGAGHGLPHESPGSMTWPLVFLGIGAVLAGYLWVGIAHFEPWMHWLEPSLGAIGAEHQGAVVAMGFGTLAAAVGIGLAWSWYYRAGVETPKRLAESYSPLYRFLFDKWRVDELYDATVLRASRGLGQVSGNFDKAAVDGLLATATGFVVRGLGFLFTRIQNGLVHAYSAAMVIGIAAVGLWFVIPHPFFEVEPDQSLDAAKPVRFQAGPGPGYEYRWDFDSDGEFDTDWQRGTTATHIYSADQFLDGAVVTLVGVGYGVGREEFRLEPGDVLPLDAELLGNWQRVRDAFVRTRPLLAEALPHIEARKDGIVVRPNGARVRHAGRPVTEEEIRVGQGGRLKLGEASLMVGGAVQATLAVRNIFGFEASDTVTLTLQSGAEAGEPRADSRSHRHPGNGAAESLTPRNGVAMASSSLLPSSAAAFKRDPDRPETASGTRAGLGGVR